MPKCYSDVFNRLSKIVFYKKYVYTINTTHVQTTSLFENSATSDNKCFTFAYCLVLFHLYPPVTRKWRWRFILDESAPA